MSRSLAIPGRIDRQHLHVDRHGVHALEPVLDGVSDEMLLRAFGFGDHVGRLVTHQRERFVEQAVRMDVDGLDPLAFDLHRQAPATSLRVHRVQHPATAEHDTRRALEKVSSCGHDDVSPRKIAFDFSFMVFGVGAERKHSLRRNIPLQFFDTDGLDELCPARDVVLDEFPKLRWI